MKSFEEGLALLAVQEKIVQEAKAEMARIRGEMKTRFSPVKIGDEVTSNHGYAHRDKRIRITDVRTTTDPSKAGFIAVGDVLKKDGSPGSFQGEYYTPPSASA